MLEELRKGRDLVLGGAVLCGLFSGLYFAVADVGRVNPLVSFLGGLVTGPLFLFFGYGFIIGGIHLAIGLDARFNKPKPRETYGGGHYPPSELKQGLCMLGGFALTAMWMIPLYWAVLKLPVIGDQMGFMLKD